MSDRLTLAEKLAQRRTARAAKPTAPTSSAGHEERPAVQVPQPQSVSFSTIRKEAEPVAAPQKAFEQVLEIHERQLRAVAETFSSVVRGMLDTLGPLLSRDAANAGEIARDIGELRMVVTETRMALSQDIQASKEAIIEAINCHNDLVEELIKRVDILASDKHEVPAAQVESESHKDE